MDLEMRKMRNTLIVDGHQSAIRHLGNGLRVLRLVNLYTDQNQETVVDEFIASLTMLINAMSSAAIVKEGEDYGSGN